MSGLHYDSLINLRKNGKTFAVVHSGYVMFQMLEGASSLECTTHFPELYALAGASLEMNK